jgi:hypothetical protein
MMDVQTSEVDAELEPVNLRSCCLFLWQLLKGWTTFSQTISMKDKKYEGGGRMKVKINILFYGDNA